jgi:hypothetical protein
MISLSGIPQALLLHGLMLAVTFSSKELLARIMALPALHQQIAFSLKEITVSALPMLITQEIYGLRVT